MRAFPEETRRLLVLVAYLRRHHGAKVEEVARLLDVPRGKVSATIAQLTLCGKPPHGPDDLVDIHQERGRLYLELDQRLGRPLRLAPAEALALAIALRALAASRGEPFARTAASALRKLRATLSREVGDRVAEVEQRIVLEGEDRGVEERFATLAQGLRERREVELEYFTKSRDELTTRHLRPYLLTQHLGSWYAVGHDGLRGEVRIFKVERIGSAKLTDARFAIPRDFKPEAYKTKLMFITSEERHAHVRFHPPAARIIAETWDASRVERKRDGTVVGRLVYVNPEGVANWVLAFGVDAEVLDPPELRTMVAERCRAALRLYR